ncbi:MAG: DNRLRE domain-containing protein [Phycisphaerales bacterium]|jgi:hypothetical protein
MRISVAAFSVAALALAGLAHGFDTVVLSASADNTMYEYEEFQGDLSNGIGSYFFAGETAGALRRRGLLRFDIASAVPAGSTIRSATLTLHLSQTAAGPQTVTLHRATGSWGEATSDAPGQEGGGAAAKINDATWRHRFYDTTFWNTPGGDYMPANSSSTPVVDIGFYTWNSTPIMAADIQSWLNSPATNNGWIIIGNESGIQTAKRFDSRENPNESFRPSLSITFDLPVVCDPDLNQDGNADQGDVDYLVNVVAGGPNDTGIDPDFNIDGNVDQGDIDALINVIAGGECP